MSCSSHFRGLMIVHPCVCVRVSFRPIGMRSTRVGGGDAVLPVARSSTSIKQTSGGSSRDDCGTILEVGQAAFEQVLGVSIEFGSSRGYAIGIPSSQSRKGSRKSASTYPYCQLSTSGTCIGFDRSEGVAAGPPSADLLLMHRSQFATGKVTEDVGPVDQRSTQQGNPE
ncbi:hypothetical protein CALVIDRAFT_555994 [Calocera viscosa TUFC12733]|uniref:Uncharacterized protein n=1 Tax=Calocera viscosa (strain TUFC12733) TaxID=1330018 RepID=A0A167KUQ3_CALVF|nr:hypothetical protein CALVIDRAFT_555994 [Calocera viscosa TUFC12733]